MRDEDNGLEIIKTCLESIKLNSCQCENLLQYVLIYLFTDEEERNYIKMIFLKNSQITPESHGLSFLSKKYTFWSDRGN